MRNQRVIGAVGIIGGVALLFMFVIQPLLTSKPSGGSIQRSPKADKPTEIPFTHEGTLWFIQPEGDTLKTLDLEIADNDYERQRGLMDRFNMSEDQSMLFIFNQERPQSFWMKNTHLSLDIIYVGSNLEIVSIQKNTTPYSTKSLPSEGNAQYVVEVIGGFCDKYGIGKGTRIAYERN